MFALDNDLFKVDKFLLASDRELVKETETNN
jgi:hypothetical protein